MAGMIWQENSSNGDDRGPVPATVVLPDPDMDKACAMALELTQQKFSGRPGQISIAFVSYRAVEEDGAVEHRYAFEAEIMPE